MKMSGRQLAACVRMSARTIGRLERAGVLERHGDGTFPLQENVQRLFEHFKTRPTGRLCSSASTGSSTKAGATSSSLAKGEHTMAEDRRLRLVQLMR